MKLKFRRQIYIGKASTHLEGGREVFVANCFPASERMKGIASNDAVLTEANAEKNEEGEFVNFQMERPSERVWSTTNF